MEPLDLLAPSPVLLRTERLCLTLPSVATAPPLVAFLLRNRERFRPTDGAQPEGSLTELWWRERLVELRAEYLAGRSTRLFLRRAEEPSGPVLGTASLTEIVRGPFQAAYLGYRVDGAWEGRGLMFEALQAVLGFAFGTLRLHRVMANHLPENLRSARLLRRLGFVVEGYARDYLFVDGQWRDHVLTALTNPAPSAPDLAQGRKARESESTQ
ncbi:MAG: GNAT family N-acetyltransferase [Deltaproteobacteria bacterium]|nr:GNAT family N-acetyltransferase [Deltaproteobacteria bacterium]